MLQSMRTAKATRTISVALVVGARTAWVKTDGEGLREKEPVASYIPYNESIG